MSDFRVAITGAGPVCGLGLGFDAVSAGLLEGRGAIGPITLFDPAPYGRECGAEVQGFDVNEYTVSKQAYLDRSAELAFAAMNLAVKDAGLDVASLDREMTGLVLGTGWGCLDTSAVFFSDILEKGARFAKPFLFPHAYPNTVISLTAIEYGLTGYHMNYASGATASAQALVQAYDLVRTGRQSTVFAGGYEALSAVRMAVEVLRGRLSGGAGAAEICAPFDRKRNGTVLGEGCGILVLEEFERARKRGARIRGEITGAAIAGDIAAAMRGAGLSDGAGACVIAAADGTADLDRAELEGLLSIPCLAQGRVPVTALKSTIGDTEGASGALHLAAGLCMLRDGFLPAVRNLVVPGSNGVDFVIKEGRRAEVRKVFINALDEGGNAACLAVGKV